MKRKIHIKIIIAVFFIFLLICGYFYRSVKEESENQSEQINTAAISAAMDAINRYAPEVHYKDDIDGWTVIESQNGNATVWAPNIYGKIYVMMKFDGNNYIPYTIGVNGDKKLDISLNTTISTNEHDSSHELAEQSAIDCLSAYYSGEDIYSTSINGTKIEVEIMSPYSASDSAPEDWATIQSTLQQACSDLQSSMADFDIQTAILYFIDSEENNLLTVMNGKIGYDAFGGEYASTTDNPPTISLEEFEAIQTGMSYQEVFDIVGSRGTVLSEVDVGLGDEYYTAVYYWDGEGSLGANANITFQGGKVSAKAQFGLE